MNQRRRTRKACDTTRTTTCIRSICPNLHFCNPRLCLRCKRCLCKRCPCRCRCTITPASSPELQGIHAQLETASPIQLEHEDPVLFDKIIHNADNDIRYDHQTGKFFLNTKATYLVNWDITVEGSYQSASVSFALLIDDQIQGISTLPISVGQLSGSSLITMKTSPAILSLVNYTNDIIQLSRYTPVANITIAKITCPPIRRKRRPC